MKEPEVGIPGTGEGGCGRLYVKDEDLGAVAVKEPVVAK